MYVYNYWYLIIIIIINSGKLRKKNKRVKAHSYAYLLKSSGYLCDQSYCPLIKPLFLLPLRERENSKFDGECYDPYYFDDPKIRATVSEEASGSLGVSGLVVFLHSLFLNNVGLELLVSSKSRSRMEETDQ